MQIAVHADIVHSFFANINCPHTLQKQSETNLHTLRHFIITFVKQDKEIYIPS